MSDFDIQGTILLKYTGTNEDVVIPDGIETIGEGAFRNCRFLRNVTIPGTVRKIESNAFSSCTKLQSIVIPEGVEVIYSGAFYYCLKLKTPTLFCSKNLWHLPLKNVKKLRKRQKKRM